MVEEKMLTKKISGYFTFRLQFEHEEINYCMENV